MTHFPALFARFRELRDLSIPASQRRNGRDFVFYIQLDIIGIVRPVCFLGDSLKSIRDFPEDARHDAGYQLDKVQRGVSLTISSRCLALAKVSKRFVFQNQVAPTA